MAEDTRPALLNPSKLGTKDHWESVYAQEYNGYKEDPDIPGVSWFEESGAEERMVEYLGTLRLGEPNAQEAGSIDDPALRLVDIGTGNGRLLLALRDEGWQADMVGLDYSAASVELARQLSEDRRSEGERAIRFACFDILKDSPEKHSLGHFDAALDKGTFDAISLSGEAVDGEGRKGCEVYARRAAQLLRPGSGLLLITSCNWTADELVKWFDIPQFEYSESIPFPSFEFGGERGQTLSCVCFRRTAEQDQT